MNYKKGLLEELMQYQPKGDKLSLVETQGINVVHSVINLIEYIDSSFDDNISDILIRKMLLTIKNRDPLKFEKTVGLVREALNGKKE